MKNILFKKILIVVLTPWLFLLPTVDVIAENHVEYTYYSRKDWVNQHQLFDTEFSSLHDHFINSKDLKVTLNALGTIHYVNTVDFTNITGKNPTVLMEKGTEDNPSVVHIQFGLPIKVHQLQLSLSAVNKETGNEITKSIWLDPNIKVNNGKISWDKSTLLKEKIHEDFIFVDVDKEIQSILITFDEFSVHNEYTLSYLQIPSYSLYQHVEWVGYPIENTETKKVVVKKATGEYSIDGTNNNWYREADTIFSPSIHIISDYRPLLTQQTVLFDYGRGQTISAYSIPESMKNISPIGDRIRGYYEIGNRPTSTFYSYSNGGIAFPYIVQEKNTGIQYGFIPVYWSQTKDYSRAYNVHSNDASWCQHVTGSRSIPCYKHQGHHANGRYNSFDVVTDQYSSIVYPENRYIKKITYDVIDAKTNKIASTIIGVDELKQLSLQDTGIWYIRATLEDKVGQTGIKSSKPFYIDREKPIAIISLPEEEYYSDDIVGSIKVEDRHSGIQRWRYQKIVNDKIMYTSPWLTSHEETIGHQDNGKVSWVVEVYDNVGNFHIEYSPSKIIQKTSVELTMVSMQSYDLNGEKPVAYITLQGDDFLEQVTHISVFQDGKNIIDKEVMVVNTVVDAISIVPKEKHTDIKVVVSQGENVQQLVLRGYQKTEEVIETELSILSLEEIVASFVTKDGQTDYKESIQLQLNASHLKLFSGQGIEHTVAIDYNNPCSVFEKGVCSNKQGIILFKPTLQYSEGSLSMKRIVGDDMKVKLALVDGLYRLGQVYVDKSSGEVFEDNLTIDNYLDGGRKWYTNPHSECKDYDVVMNAPQLGFNKITVSMKSSYEIEDTYLSKIYLRFVEKENPFPNGLSDMWKHNETWFSTIDETKYDETITLSSTD